MMCPSASASSVMGICGILLVVTEPYRDPARGVNHLT